jgi:phosphomannomutase
MSAPTGFGTEGFRGVIARDFALLAPLGMDNSYGVKWFYDRAWRLFRVSRTEPGVRIYAEVPRPDLVQVLLE